MVSIIPMQVFLGDDFIIIGVWYLVSSTWYLLESSFMILIPGQAFLGDGYGYPAGSDFVVCVGGSPLLCTTLVPSSSSSLSSSS